MPTNLKMQCPCCKKLRLIAKTYIESRDYSSAFWTNILKKEPELESRQMQEIEANVAHKFEQAVKESLRKHRGLK